MVMSDNPTTRTPWAKLNAHRPAQGDHRAGGAVLGFRCLGTWDQRHRHNHGGGQQEQGAKRTIPPRPTHGVRWCPARNHLPLSQNIAVSNGLPCGPRRQRLPAPDGLPAYQRGGPPERPAGQASFCGRTERKKWLTGSAKKRASLLWPVFLKKEAAKLHSVSLEETACFFKGPLLR